MIKNTLLKILSKFKKHGEVTPLFNYIIMTYEELYYRSMTDHELQRVINTHQFLDGYVDRCQQELNRRKEEQNEITSL